MSTMLSERLAKWASENPGDQADFLKEASVALTNVEQRAQWSFVDITSELESRATIRHGVSSLWRILSVVSYLLPILITWWHLRSASQAFSGAVQRLKEGESLDFLAFWTGAVGGYDGVLLQAAALQVVFSIFGIFGLQIFVGMREPRERPAITPELRSLALQAQLTFFQSRAVTPRELVDAMSEAANQLGEALESSKNSLGAIEQVASAVVGSATTLNQVSESLRTSASAIATGVAPLSSLPQQLNVIVGAMENAAESLQETQTALAGTTNSVLAVMGASKAAADDAARMSTATRELLRVATEAQTLISEVAGSIREAAQASQRLGAVVTEHEPHVAILNAGIKELVNSVDRVESIAKEFKYSADKYAEVNEAHRKAAGN